MKKSTKTILLISSSMLALGLVICFIALFSVGFDGSQLSWDYKDYPTTGSETVRVNEQLSILEDSSIFIDLSWSDAYIGVSPDDTVHITYYSTEDFKYEINQTDNKLVLKQHPVDWKKGWFTNNSFNLKDLEVTVLIPKQFKGSLSIYNERGAVTVKETLDLSAFSVNNDWGDMNIFNISANSIDLYNSRGTIQAEKISSLGDIALRLQWGQAELRNAYSDGDIIVKNNKGSSNLEQIICKGTLSATSEWGEISVFDIDTNSMYLQNDRGATQAEEISSLGDITLHSKWGQVELRNVDSGGNIIQTNDRGNITLEQVICVDLDLDCSWGNIELRELDAQNITLFSDRGSISGSIVGTENDFTVKSTSNRGSNNLPENWGSGSKMLDVKADWGSIDVRFTE